MKFNMMDVISDNHNIEIIKRLIKDAVDETITGTVRRPQAQAIVDWRQKFVIQDSVTQKTARVIKHKLPFDPKAGEVWKIPTENYGGDGDRVSIAIDRVVYDWEPLEYENSVVYGWFLEIDIECHLLSEDEG